MATRAQIARQKYGCTLADLTPGQQAAVTRAYNAQGNTDNAAPARGSGDFATVKFARPNVNGTKECVVDSGKTVAQAAEQGSIIIDTKKEGVMMKNGRSPSVKVSLSDVVVDGATYLIVPGVDSAF